MCVRRSASVSRCAASLQHSRSHLADNSPWLEFIAAVFCALRVALAFWQGLTTLKGIAADMNSELDRQAPMLENLEDKVDDVGAELKTQNVKLKETLTKLRSSRNFCIDVVLIILLLGIGAYIYSLVK